MSCTEKPLTFPSAGYELSAYIHIPSAGANAMALFLHGFTGNKIEANRLFVDLARALCRAGIASFRFDYRCHGESPLDFEEFRFDFALEDAENALRYVHEVYGPRRLALIGLSMGGHIAVRLAAKYPDKVSAVVLLSPALRFSEPGRDLTKFVIREGEYFILGPYRMRIEAAEAMFRLSVIELADVIKAPTLLIHAKDDNVVPYTQSLEFHQRLVVEKKRLVVLDEGGHVFSTYTSKSRVIKEVVEWLKEVLLQG